MVDLTPEDQRTFVGSSNTNSALELAAGYNVIQRLLGTASGPGGGPGGAQALYDCGLQGGQ